jgi:hypothetical protein
MFIPNSPKPPSGMALSLVFRVGIGVLLTAKRFENWLRLPFSKLKKEFVFEALSALSPFVSMNPPVRSL